MEQEAVGLLAHQLIQVLRITCGTQSCSNQSLSFTTGEQCGTVGTRQYAGAHVQATDHVFFTAVDTRLATQHAATNDVFLNAAQDVLNFRRVQGFVLCQQGFNNAVLDRIYLSVTLLFFGDVISVAQAAFCQFCNARVQRFVDCRCLPIPLRLAGFGNQGIDVLDNDLLLLVAKDHRAQHLIFAQNVSFGFNHQHCTCGTGNHQVQAAFFQLVSRWVQHVLAVDVTHASSTDWAIERNTGQAQGCRGTDHRNDVRVNLRVYGNHGRDHLNFVQEAVREQWTDRTINQTGSQSFAFARTAFTTEETARDTTSSVGTLLIVNGQWEEALAWFGFFLANYGNEYCGVIHAHHNGGSGLTSHHTGLNSEGMLAILEFANDRCQQNYILRLGAQSY
ncbi:hypothetical protein D3C78_919070 [compost metagenome]